ncbi:MAG TPA: hypothetical protein VN643_18350 [Pyrinomonadaceae bacterium]|nr:hypothetical protein [Pyrinomonadaceae bacterium]
MLQTLPSLTQVLTQLADISGTDLRGTQSDPREEVFITYTQGNGRFSPDKKYITLSMIQYKLNGEQDGHHEGVWEAQFKDPRVLIGRPPNPEGAMNVPQGPVPHVDIIAFTKGIWVFGDDSSVTAVGPALSHLMPLTDGSFLFAVTCAQTITNGTGRYSGAQGLKTSLGSTFIEAGTNLFDPTKEVRFSARTIDTFRIVKARDMKR